ncbi:uncharacterized protein N7515_005099 [Penicillium bovifimosum]|uniref:Uncharacterized protein n=1 Tax=Penicillium bovifimosum TaxID=126998 RepID=A0A9W9H1C0_9EURO|nr:uncharacterized protein N7515_005099 [Penicillium bovifimosum]KAJ5135821.1 hypothetical protein N7515_005099 [Penicillium bovifimosum]
MSLRPCVKPPRCPNPDEDESFLTELVHLVAEKVRHTAGIAVYEVGGMGLLLLLQRKAVKFLWKKAGGGSLNSSP